MKLLSSLKEKKRYVVFEIKADKNLTLSDVEKVVDSAVNEFLGQLGKSKAGVMFIREKWNAKTQRFLMKVNNKYVDELKSAMLFIKRIKNKPVIVESVLVTSTIKKAHDAI
ncbi:MAG: hypothetical protein CMH61_00485 [Nanoarchaeota archaeon]|nr:hypothetical protein [Nanoarchaeota archaeon]|tara:strand:+ start:2244 stop:2576 length:333 start_codon:yes stop_codon:yes gene_type:complete